MKKHVLTVVLIVLFTLVAAPLAYAETFTRYLQKGDRGEDVILLQKELNTDPDTKVSEAGDGAPGSETDFYGEMTKQAVIKLQKKHNLGSKFGFFTIYSGTLDDKTRAFLNGQATTTATSTPQEIAQEKLNETYRKGQEPRAAFSPYIQSVSPRTVTEGDTVTIIGRNFSTSTDNTIRLTYNSTATTSPDGTTLTFTAKSSIQTMFDKEARNLDDDERENTKSKMGDIPLFITVQNQKGVSNPYQVYYEIK